MAQSQTTTVVPAQTAANDDDQVVRDTAKANRAALLTAYLSACSNLRIAPEAELKAELESMTSYYCIDPADDALYAGTHHGLVRISRSSSRPPPTRALSAPTPRRSRRPWRG